MSSAPHPQAVSTVTSLTPLFVVALWSTGFIGAKFGLPDAQPRYRLLTTLLDPQRAPAMELAALYHQRWEIEAVFDELKTHLRQSRRVLRSKTPELVRQEFYGWVLAHYAVRWLLHQGATRARIPHAEQSFKGHVELLRRTQPLSGAFPPRAAQTQATMVP